MYKQVSTQIDLPALEREILEHWQSANIFEKSLRPTRPEKVFYDGPPFPTGTPHFGTVFVSIIKDALARYFSMAGFSVPRRWGWDCHGLPIENAVEQQLGIKNKTAIEQQLGVAAFNRECRQLVSHCNAAWEIYVRKVGRWVDYANAYRTMDLDYMESVLWVFKQCYDQGLIYKDYRVTPYCYRCETALSISDTRESDSTRPRQDPEIIVKFAALDELGGRPTYYLAWTTTPWTLISNLALAVGADHRYVAVEHAQELFIMAEALLAKWPELFGKAPQIRQTFAGRDLIGRRYQPPFPYFKQLGEQGYFRIFHGDFVTLDEGVGIVHCAPAFGEEDYWMCKRQGLAVQNPVDARGCFTAAIPEFAGRNVHACNQDIIRHLKNQGALVLQRTLEHNYPHCWRCRTPLIYRAMDAWYFAVEKIKDRLLEHNAAINWVPAHVKQGRFGKWLAGARDWNISRSRYWGTPIPVWECERPECAQRRVLGSLAEISAQAGRAITDLHKEVLDAINWACPACGGRMRRVPEVLDCWFESGAMPFGQCHYPFENKLWFEKHFPADFIVEYPGQIRGWFYYLHVLAVALRNSAAFKNCLVHGTLLAADGTKISKSKKNFTDPMELIERYGADALRLYLLNSPAVLMEDLNFQNSGVRDQIKQTLLPLWNAYAFFTTYANIDNYRGDPQGQPQSTHRLDQWILAILHQTAAKVSEAYAGFYLNHSMAPLLDCIEALTNWYIRQSRERFWGGGLSADKQQAYATLYYVLITLMQLLAPAAPFISDWIYRQLTGAESVHLASWPAVPEAYKNEQLIEENRLARAVVSLGLALRQRAGLRVRQPLPGLRIALPPQVSRELLLPQIPIIKNELNVKTVSFIDDPEALASRRLVPNARVLGPRWGRAAQNIIAAAKAGQFREQGDNIVVFQDGHEWVLERQDVEIQYQGRAGAEVLCDKGLLVALDTALSDELREEGLANELNRQIQDLRKKAGYQVSDRIVLHLDGQLAPRWQKQLARLALADLSAAALAQPDAAARPTLAGQVFNIQIKRKDSVG